MARSSTWSLATDPARLFLVLGALLGVAYALATPPMHVPDERRHLLRTAQTSSPRRGTARPELSRGEDRGRRC